MTADHQEQQEVDELQAQKDFEAGEAQETKPDVPVKPTQDEPKAETQTEEPRPTPKPQPKYVRLTEDQYKTLEAAAQKTSALEGQISKVFGTVGDMQQIVRKIQSATPAGAVVDLPEDVVSEMEKDFPELAGHLKAALGKALKGVRGTGAAASDPAATERAVRAAVIAHEVEALEDAHPTWKEIVGAVDSAGRADPNNEFRKWLGKQDEAYQRKVNATNSSAVIGKAIDKFMASKTPARSPATPTKVTAQSARIQGAIRPKGDGGTPAPRNTDNDDFEQGFATR